MIDAAWHDYDTGADMAEAVVDHIGAVVEAALAARGQALVAFPGGASPAPIFERLADAAIGWDQVTIIPTDDRLVPLSSPLSNVAMIARYFRANGVSIFPLAEAESADYRMAGEAADARLSELEWPPDLVWLGVGRDGHTASIFPGPDLDEALDGPETRKAVGVLPDPLPPEAPVARVTLSRAAILSARGLLLAFSGPDKRAVVERAISEGPLSATPIGRVLADAKSPISIHWSAT